MIIRKVTQNCIDLIERFEGFRDRIYICPAGYPTIGIGHVILANETFDQITQEEAESILHGDLIKSEKSVLRLIAVPLEDCQYDALVSFVFNIGGGALQRSTLRAKINRQEYQEAADEFPKWCYARGRKLKGLFLRRMAERALFLRSM